MTWSYAFISFLLAHAIADFGVRNEFLKRWNKPPAQKPGVHLAVLIGVSLLLLSSLGWFSVALTVAAAAIHWLADYGFGATLMWKPDIGPKHRWFFGIQQVLKVASLGMFAQLAAQRNVPAPLYMSEIARALGCAGVMAPLGFVFAYVCAVFAGDAFVSLVLTNLPADSADSDPESRNASRLVGAFEAILITTFVIAHRYDAVGLMLAAEVVVRGGWFARERDRSDSFLVGVFARVTWSMAAGLLALWLAGRPLFPQ